MYYKRYNFAIKGEQKERENFPKSRFTYNLEEFIAGMKELRYEQHYIYEIYILNYITEKMKRQSGQNARK